MPPPPRRARAEKSRNHTHTGVSRSPLRPITTRDDSHDHLITLHESKYVTHESDDKHTTHTPTTHPPDRSAARAGAIDPAFRGRAASCRQPWGCVFARRLARNVLLRSMTRSRLARDGRARVRSVAEVVPLARVSRRRSRWIRVSRAIGDERRASERRRERGRR